jgi:hypothetical protein
LPTGYAKARTLGVPVTLDEFGHLEASAKTSKQATWEWIRSSLNAATIPCPKLIELCRPVGAMASATGCTGFSAGLKVIDTRRNRIPHVFGNDQILCGNVASTQWVFTPQIYCPEWCPEIDE